MNINYGKSDSACGTNVTKGTVLTSRQRDQRNINPHKLAVAAMWLYGSRYAAQRGGSMDFWDSLPPGEQTACRDLVADIEKAQPERKD